METAEKPRLDLARKVLPKGLMQAILAVFTNGLEGCVLVGGTALAGFYAGHRRSDDMNLFTADPVSHSAAVASVKALVDKGAVLSSERAAPGYYHALCEFHQHRFTVDVVLDKNFLNLHLAENAGDVVVASLPGLLATKGATLVSRCSEKDLFDLLWLFEHLPSVSIKQFIEMAQKVDAGAYAESMLISLNGVRLDKQACGFAEAQGVSSTEVLEQVSALRRSLLKKLSETLHADKSESTLASVVKELRRL